MDSMDCGRFPDARSRTPWKKKGAFHETFIVRSDAPVEREEDFVSSVDRDRPVEGRDSSWLFCPMNLGRVKYRMLEYVACSRALGSCSLAISQGEESTIEQGYLLRENSLRAFAEGKEKKPLILDAFKM